MQEKDWPMISTQDLAKIEDAFFALGRNGGNIASSPLRQAWEELRKIRDLYLLGAT